MPTLEEQLAEEKRQYALKVSELRQLREDYGAVLNVSNLRQERAESEADLRRSWERRAGELTTSLKQVTARLDELQLRLKNYHAEVDGDDIGVPIDGQPRFVQDDDDCNLQALRRWVVYASAKAQAEGGIFDTGMRCVSEGNEVVYLDPERIVAYMDRAERAEARVKELEKQLFTIGPSHA